MSHAVLSPTQALVRQVEKLCQKNPRFKPDAYYFVMAGLQYTVGQLSEPRHITGQELAQGLRLYALDQFGPLAAEVLAYWGLERTDDFGAIVFSLVEASLLRKTETDCIDDFRELYNFCQAFDPEPLYTLAD